MKTLITNLFIVRSAASKQSRVLPPLMASLGLILADCASAQTVGSDGANPRATLVLSGNTLYGTAGGGGSSGNGTVFAVNTDGTGFRVLHSFTPFADPSQTNGDGAAPYAGLILSGNSLYGTAYYGGSSRAGTVFAVNTDGTGFATLHSFTAAPAPYYTNSDGALPQAALLLADNTLYGTASSGGSSGNGTVFAINTDGSAFTNVHSFTGTSTNSSGLYTNSDGAVHRAGLARSGNTLYGTTTRGGSSGYGTVFAVNTDGTGFTTLHDGAYSYAALVLANSTLYGTAFRGGSLSGGSVFALNTDGSGYTNLHSFPFWSAGDGALPYAALVLANSTLYGTALWGGSTLNGTVFALNTDGTGFTNLHSFNFCSDGTGPTAGLVLAGNTLYGATPWGGCSGYGTLFAVDSDGTGFRNLHGFSAPGSGQQPQLTIQFVPSSYVSLRWLDFEWVGSDAVHRFFSTYRLQSSASLGPSANWNNVSGTLAGPGYNGLDSPVLDAQRFYRLIAQVHETIVCTTDLSCNCVSSFPSPYCVDQYGAPCAYPCADCP
jgi:uncharacterized repeat protein (TIGR03803 family)